MVVKRKLIQHPGERKPTLSFRTGSVYRLAVWKHILIVHTLLGAAGGGFKQGKDNSGDCPAADMMDIMRPIRGHLPAEVGIARLFD